MKYQELLDHLLAVYYHSKKVSPNVALRPFWIVEELTHHYTSSDVIEMMDYLGAEGYLQHYNQKSGAVSTITPRGQLQYESLSPEYREQIEQTLEEKGILDIIRVYDSQQKSEEEYEQSVNSLMDKIEKGIQTLGGVDEDVEKDLGVLRLEFSKRKPDQEVLRIKVEELIEKNLLFEYVQELKSRLYLR